MCCSAFFMLSKWEKSGNSYHTLCSATFFFLIGCLISIFPHRNFWLIRATGRKGSNSKKLWRLCRSVRVARASGPGVKATAVQRVSKSCCGPWIHIYPIMWQMSARLHEFETRFPSSGPGHVHQRSQEGQRDSEEDQRIPKFNRKSCK